MHLRSLLIALSLACIACFNANAGEEDSATSPRCAEYCTTIADACTDANEQYATELACTNMCELMTPGAENEASGNTLGCRMTWALEAFELQGEELAQTCRWAGPAGDGTCGGLCESFCTYAMDICSGDNAQWATATECITECNSLPEEPPYSTAVIDGPSRSCRLYHLGLATANPADHCPHVGGQAPCN